MIISAGASSLGAFFVAYGGRCFNFFKRYSVGRWIFLHIESTEKVEKRDLGAVSNGYKPPQNLNFIHYFYSFSVLSPLACFQGVDTLRIASKHAKGMSLRYDESLISNF